MRSWCDSRSNPDFAPGSHENPSPHLRLRNQSSNNNIAKRDCYKMWEVFGEVKEKDFRSALRVFWHTL